MQALEVILETDTIKVSVLRSPSGVRGRTLISFTGVGHALGGLDVQKPEFFKAHQWYETMIFVSDLKRSWANAIDFDALLTAIAPFTKDATVDTLGNSMGGFLALLLPAKTPVRRALAIVPQISVHPDTVPWETRWQDYRSEIKDWSYTSVTDHLIDQTKYVVALGEDPKDVKQAALLPERDNLSVLQLPKMGHKLSANLKKQGLLELFVGSALQHDDPDQWFATDFLPKLAA